MSIIVAIIIFSVIVIFHEFGHFITAKRCGIQVNEFSLGLGPTIFSFGRGETKYSLKLLPFGGACMMEGEDGESENPRAFNNKKLWQRFLVVFNGPFFNFIMAWVLAVILLSLVGVDRPVIAGVIEGYSAEEEGMQEGDVITSLNGYNIHFYREISIYSFFHPGETMEVEYLRDGKAYTAVITPKMDEESGRYLLGIQGYGDRERVSVPEAMINAFYEIKYQIYMTFMSLKMLIMGQVGLNDMSGPVGIVKTIGDTYNEAAADGVFYIVINMINITILLSSNLGFMNLLPIPALDGGRIFFMIIEALRGGKKINEEIEGRIHLAGFALLMLFMLVVMFNDIHRIVG
ncbi:MAG: site-2 protease family protein [Lachnospiraceae bacterium]|nr:site-2 protease family protein [Lachnospiraceae bacterium]